MIAGLECLPCLVRQAKEMTVMTTEDPMTQKSIMRRCFDFMSRCDLDVSPPEIMHGIGELISSITGEDDPYRDIKAYHTRTALKMLPEMDRIVRESKDHFTAGLRLAIAGNIIDMGAKNSVSLQEITHTLHEAIHEPLCGTDPLELRREIDNAGSILYLADNAGETVFDRKFLEQFPGERTIIAVRGKPALNDATMDDAMAAGLDERATLMHNGSGAPATVLPDCSPEFRNVFGSADVIVSKGQGNYESLSSAEGNIFFLFRVKCDLVAHHSGFPVGSLVLLKSKTG